MKNIDDPISAVPPTRTSNGDYVGGSFGLTKREYAAIHLRVPDSGDSDIDRMILLAKRDEFVMSALNFDMYAGVHDKGSGISKKSVDDTTAWVSEILGITP